VQAVSGSTLSAGDWQPGAPPRQFVTHRFKLDEMMEAYDIFGRAAETKSIKVAISR